MEDTVLHVVVGPGKRECGKECQVWDGEERVLEEEELWEILVERGEDLAWVNDVGTSVQELISLQRMEKVE